MWGTLAFLVLVLVIVLYSYLGGMQARLLLYSRLGRIRGVLGVVRGRPLRGSEIDVYVFNFRNFAQFIIKTQQQKVEKVEVQ